MPYVYAVLYPPAACCLLAAAHVREVIEEVFGADNFVSVIAFNKTTSASSEMLASTCDFLIWFGKDRSKTRFRQTYLPKGLDADASGVYRFIRLPSGEERKLTDVELANPDLIPEGAQVFRLDNLTSQRPPGSFPVIFAERAYGPGKGYWKTGEIGMAKLVAANRVAVSGNSLAYKRFLNDFPAKAVANVWTDMGTGSFTESKLYAVQTSVKVLRRCMLMTTDPGDLVLDPTCGSGTTAYVAEQWGRRWITCDTSRVPLALARQRLLTATFPYYELKDQQAGPSGGFVYKRKQNRKGEEVGGLVPHITLKSIANDEPPAMEVLVDRPEINDSVVRVSGPFVVEATIAPAQTLDESGGDGGEPRAAEAAVQPYADVATHLDRMTEVLRLSKTLKLPGNRELVLTNVRRVADSDSIHAEAVDAEGGRVAIVFGPEDGAISSDVVYHAASEAHFLKYAQLYFFGFAIQAKARELIDDRKKLRIPSTYVAVTPDVVLSDLLKTSRASEIFSVTGLPDIEVRKTGTKNDQGVSLWQVELRGMDIFNPATMEQEAIEGQALPAWMLDTDYDGMSFFATQVFFPKTAAWDNLQKSLKATFDPSTWEHLAGTTSEPFALGDRKRIAVKVIDERGNELMRVVDVTG